VPTESNNFSDVTLVRPIASNRLQRSFDFGPILYLDKP
jgi:hypothetical protein